MKYRVRDVFLVRKTKEKTANWVEETEFSANYERYVSLRRATIPSDMPLSEFISEAGHAVR